MELLATSAAEPLRNPALVYLLRLTRGSSRDNMRRLLTRIARWFDPSSSLGAFRWEHLRYEHTQALRTYVAESFAPGTANRWILGVRGVLKEAWRLRLLSVEEYERARDMAPVRGTRIPPGRCVQPGELQALFEAATRGRYASVRARDGALVALLYGAGLRREEVARLDVTQLEIEAGSAALRVIGKNNKEARCPLPSSALPALRRWLKLRGCNPGPLFVGIGPDGEFTARSMAPSTVYERVRRLVQIAGLPRLTPHDLRRSYISDLLDANVDLATVQALARHASPATTTAYDRRGERVKVRAAELLNVPCRT